MYYFINDGYLEKSFQYREEVVVAALSEGREDWWIFNEGFGAAAEGLWGMGAVW